MTTEPSTRPPINEADAAGIGRWAELRLGGAIAAGGAVGCVAAVTGPRGLLWSGGFGWADRAGAVEAHPASTPFRSGSTTKVMTAVVAWQLIEEGAMDLDDDLAKHLRRIRPPTPHGAVTIRHLLSHSGGFEERFRATLTDRPLPEVTPRPALERLWCRQRRSPGTVIAYSNFSLGLLATVMEDVTGITFRELIHDRILGPLDLRHSGLEIPGDLPSSCATEHVVGPDGSVRQPETLLKVPFYLGSGGLFYSAEDGAAFLRSFLPGYEGPHLLQRSSLEAMRTPIEGMAGGTHRGLGWWLVSGPGDQILRHGGQTESFRATMLVIPEIQRAIVVMCVGDREGRVGEDPPPTMEPDDEVASFVETFCGAPPGPATGLDVGRGEPRAGLYRETRSAWSTSERLTESLAEPPMRLRRVRSGWTWMGAPLEAAPTGFIERSSRFPVGYLRLEGEDLISEGSSASVRVSPLTTRGWILSISLLSIMLAFGGVVAWRPRSWSGVAAVAAMVAALCMIGSVVGMVWFRRRNTRLRSSVPTLLAIATWSCGVAASASLLLPGRTPAVGSLAPFLVLAFVLRAHRPGP